MSIKRHFNFPLVYILCIVPMHTMCIHASWNTQGVLVVRCHRRTRARPSPGPLPHLSHPFVAHRHRGGGGGGGRRRAAAGDDDGMRQMVICCVSHAPVAECIGSGVGSRTVNRESGLGTREGTPRRTHTPHLPPILMMWICCGFCADDGTHGATAAAATDCVYVHAPLQMSPPYPGAPTCLKPLTTREHDRNRRSPTAYSG
jgi:hypothetical protein